MINEYKNLIINAQSGDKNSLGELIKKIENKIYATLFYLKKDENDLNDITQNVLIKLSKNLKQLKNPDYFKTWLNQIVVNTYYDYIRKNKKNLATLKLEEMNEKNIINIPDFTANPQETVLNNELDFIIKTSIDNLPIHYKIPIALREIQGLSYDEISNVTKTSIGTVKSRIARARAIIKEDLEKYQRE